jgi:hypothetical protein
MRRWLVERFFAWIQWQRRILVRWEYHAQNFLSFVQRPSRGRRCVFGGALLLSRDLDVGFAMDHAFAEAGMRIMFADIEGVATRPG